MCLSTPNRTAYSVGLTYETQFATFCYADPISSRDRQASIALEHNPVFHNKLGFENFSTTPDKLKRFKPC